MKRSEVIKEFMRTLDYDDIVIASTGFISREVYRYDRPLNFYMMGSMGNAYAIGIGLAMNVEQRVYVISGDGAALMGLGSIVTGRKYDLPNLTHMILDNRCHASTGGQPTSSEYVDFAKLGKRTVVYDIDPDDDVPPRIDKDPKYLTERFKNAILRIKQKPEISG